MRVQEKKVFTRKTINERNELSTDCVHDAGGVNFFKNRSGMFNME